MSMHTHCGGYATEMQVADPRLSRARRPFGHMRAVAVRVPAAPAAADTPLRAAAIGLAAVTSVAVLVVAVSGLAPADLGDEQVVSAERPGIPVSGSPPVTHYRVQPGDSIDRIAALHAVRVEELTAANALAERRAIEPGATVVIPAPEAPPAGLPPSLAQHAHRLTLGPLFERWAAEYGVSADLLKAVGWHESRWRVDAVSEKGAVGVGQLLPTTARWVADELIGAPLDVRDPDDNIRMSARYLRYLVDRYGGDEAAALAAYHQGPASVARDGWYAVTDRYVERVFDLRWRFAAAA